MPNPVFLLCHNQPVTHADAGCGRTSVLAWHRSTCSKKPNLWETVERYTVGKRTPYGTVPILFTSQTREVSPSSLLAQNHLSVLGKGERRSWFCCCPAAPPAVWKWSAAKNETHKNYIILTQQCYTSTTMEMKLGKEKGKKKIWGIVRLFTVTEKHGRELKTLISKNVFFYCKIPGIFLDAINSLNRNRKHFKLKKAFVLYFLRILYFLWTSHQHILAAV